MIIDFSQVRTQTLRLADIQHLYTHADLIAATNEMIDTMRDLIKDAKDAYVTFVPFDPDAYDPNAADPHDMYIAWTLGHVIAHTTASGEETASIGASLARGVQADWRDRYEVPWQTLTTVDQVVHRLEESRRMRLALLNSWPDEPHLEVLRATKSQGDLNAIGYTLRGLKHDADHVGQIAEIMRQAREAIG